MARILLIEDDNDVRQCVSLNLEMLGHDVSEATDGAYAINMLYKSGTIFDLIITDNRMLVMCGVEFTRIYKRMIGPSAKVIMITADRNSNSAADFVLLKPFDLNQLIKVIKNATRKPAKRVKKRVLRKAA